MMEIWKDVVGYEGLYEVSNHGRVRTHKDKTTYSSLHGIRKWKQRILKEKNPNGRDVRVSLWKNKTDKSYLVHRLVALAFIPEIPGKRSINHIDGNPRNNHVSNLEWCDHRENNNHAFDNNLMTSNKNVFLLNTETGESHYFRSLSKASQFLGRKPGYLSGKLKKGAIYVDQFKVFIALRPDEYERYIG
ncbi:NUMOD4 motif-containing HNH endonuclease [Jeotgalicoccus huakuii]|nr:NUMOD4 motif-containing HNH endonuclease [Jeotgalicoccus huakuii]